MKATAAKKYPFTVTLRGVSEMAADMEDRLYGAGCDDTLLWSRNGVVGVHFDREAESLGAAVASAINDVERAGYKVATVDLEEVAAV